MAEARACKGVCRSRPTGQPSHSIASEPGLLRSCFYSLHTGPNPGITLPTLPPSPRRVDSHSCSHVLISFPAQIPAGVISPPSDICRLMKIVFMVLSGVLNVCFLNDNSPRSHDSLWPGVDLMHTIKRVYSGLFDAAASILSTSKTPTKTHHPTLPLF